MAFERIVSTLLDIVTRFDENNEVDTQDLYAFARFVGAWYL